MVGNKRDRTKFEEALNVVLDINDIEIENPAKKLKIKTLAVSYKRKQPQPKQRGHYLLTKNFEPEDITKSYETLKSSMVNGKIQY
jgi:hypothetical protein